MTETLQDKEFRKKEPEANSAYLTMHIYLLRSAEHPNNIKIINLIASKEHMCFLNRVSIPVIKIKIKIEK